MLEEAQASPVSKLNPSAPRNVSLIFFFLEWENTSGQLHGGKLFGGGRIGARGC